MKKLIHLSLLLLLMCAVLGCASGPYSGPPKRGIVTDGVYTNDYFKLSFTVPEGWGFYSDEEFYNNFNISLPTNEDLASTVTGYTDVYIFENDDQENRISITYYSNLDDKLTDEQIKNRLSANASDVSFGDIELINIGEENYSMISGPTSDGTLFYYYIWSEKVYGNHRPCFFIHLDSGNSITDFLKNFTQAIE